MRRTLGVHQSGRPRTGVTITKLRIGTGVLMIASQLAAVLFFSAGLLTACHGGDLTRDHAKQLIETNPNFMSGTRVLSVPWNVAGMYEQIVKFDGVNASRDNMAVQPAYQDAVRSARQGWGDST